MKVTLTTVSFQVSDKMLEYATTSSPEAAALFGRSLLEKMDAGQEHVILLVVNAANAVTGFKVISSGGTDSAQVDPKLLFRSALTMGTGVSGLILIHNHPSGDPTPSAQDTALTNQLQAGSKILEFRFLDHVIIGNRGRSFSYREHGLLR